MRYLSLMIFFCSSFLLHAQPEVGAFNYGKYDIGLTAEYRLEEGIRLGAKVGIRSYRGPFNRAINFSANLSTGLSTFRGEPQISGDIGAYQVYANGNDARNGFGIGTGARLSYDCYGVEEEFRLQATMNPGLYNFNSSYSISAVTDIVNIQMEKGANEGDNIELFSEPKIGYTLDWQNASRLGVVQYGYMDVMKEDKEEESKEEDEEKDRNWRLGIHLHKSF